MADPRPRRSIVQLVAHRTLDPSLAALVWLLVEARLPLVVAAGPRGTGKSTILEAALDFLPPGTMIHPLAGYAEDFNWLPEAAELGWRPHGFRGIAAGWQVGDRFDGGRGAGPQPAARVEPATTYLLVHELSDHLPIYTWGEQARITVRALSVGYGLGATIHAESLEDIFDELASEEVGLTEDELSRLGVVLILRIVRDPATGEPVRRIVAAHYVRPVARDAGGHIQRLGPAVLATWDPATDRFEDFSWGVVPELAERVSRRAGAFEAERDRRAEYLAGLVAARVDEPAAVRAAIDHYRHAGPLDSRVSRPH